MSSRHQMRADARQGRPWPTIQPGKRLASRTATLRRSALRRLATPKPGSGAGLGRTLPVPARGWEPLHRRGTREALHRRGTRPARASPDSWGRAGITATPEPAPLSGSAREFGKRETVSQRGGRRGCGRPRISNGTADRLRAAVGGVPSAAVRARCGPHNGRRWAVRPNTRRGSRPRRPAVRQGPVLSGGCEGERPAILHTDRPGLFCCTLAPPFVEPARRDQAATGGECGPERGPLPCRSERALTSLWPMRGSLAHPGAKPQRSIERRRRMSRSAPTAASRLGSVPRCRGAGGSTAYQTDRKPTRPIPGEGLREAVAHGWRRYPATARLQVAQEAARPGWNVFRTRAGTRASEPYLRRQAVHDSR